MSTTTTRKPSKPWRVEGHQVPASVDYRSERAAYEAVAAITRRGRRARVYHWEEGSWCLYERAEPVPSETKGEDR